MENGEYIQRLKHVLLKESPILFLGAGFSSGAKTKKDRDIPVANELKKIIIHELLKYDVKSTEYDDLMSHSLSKVSQFAASEKTKAHLTDFLTEIFKDVTPCSFHNHLTKYSWKKIYTTNIDDLVENVYKKNRLELKIQNTSRKSTLIKNSTEYIKLHGCVNNPSEGYTFSSEEYIDSMQRQLDYRFNSLSFDMQTDNFIFIGTSFDEINIDYYLKLYENAGFNSSRGQLFFINPNPSMVFKSRIRDLKGFLIKWNTEDFLNYLNDLNYNETEQQHLEKALQNSGFINFENIKSNYLPSKQYDSHLYLGYHPTWIDIFSEWDFIHPIVKTVLDDIVNTELDNVSYYSIFGKAYVGKSCTLMRIAAELYKQGFEVISFIGRYFDIDPFLNYIKENKTKNMFVLILDNASFYYFLLERFSKIPLNGKKLIVLTTSRPLNHISKRYYLTNYNFKEYFYDSKLDANYAKVIIQKLREKGFLGELTKIKTEKEQINYFVDKNDLMSALLEITYGRGFIERFIHDLNPLLEKGSIEKDLLINLAIFDKADLSSFPLELITLFYNTNADYLKNNIDNFIKTKNSNEICIRSGIFTNKLLGIAGQTTILGNIKKILIAISPQVDEYRTNYWKIIFESLCKVDNLRHFFNIPILDIKKLMYGLKDNYGNISYYWLQLGTSEQTTKDFGKALNHFRQAETMHPYSYHIQHVIGRNFLKQANYINNYEIAKDYFYEGETILLELIKHREKAQVRSYSIHSYLYEKIKFIQKFNIEVTNHEIQNMYHYLQMLTEKDKNDIMAKDMNNYFYKFLKSREKLGLIKIDFYDLENYWRLFQENNMDQKTILKEFDDN